jgi:hypothetical protein
MEKLTRSHELLVLLHVLQTNIRSTANHNDPNEASSCSAAESGVLRTSSGRVMNRGFNYSAGVLLLPSGSADAIDRVIHDQ